MQITQALVKEVLDYNQDTGIFVWKRRARIYFNCDRSWNRWNNRYSGKVAGSVASHGYIRICINNVRHLAHRLAYLYVHGVMPKNVLHDNQNPLSNGINNLKDGTHKENLRNTRLSKNNTSGFNGVYWSIGKRKWCAQIMVDGRCIPLGVYVSKRDAIAARKAANIKYGFHKNHGKAA